MMKRCSECKTDKPESEFSSNRSKKDGLHDQCKVCNRAYRIRNKSHIDKRNRQYRESNREQLRAYWKQYYAQNSEKRREKSIAYYHRHHDRIRAECNTKYTKKGRYRVPMDIQRARKREYEYRWKRVNKDKVNSYTRNRRANKRSIGGTHTSEDIQRQGKCQKWKCWWCGNECADKYHVDHLVPLNRGGHNNPSNIVISCPTCNLKKNDKTPDEFSGRLL